MGITRAKQNLAITCAKQRMVRGETQYNKVSRFVKEIPRELLSGAVRKEKEHKEPKEATYQQAKQIFRAKPYGMPRKTGKILWNTGQSGIARLSGRRPRQTHEIWRRNGAEYRAGRT